MAENQISQRLRVLRGSKKRREAARKAGVLEANWSRWEKGHVKPGRESLFKIATAFGVSPRWILDGEGQEPKVAEAPGPYEKLDGEARKIIKEVERFLAVADKQKKLHLLRQLRYLRQAEEAKTKK